MKIVIKATSTDKIKLTIFLVIANFLPRIIDSAGSWIIPTVTQATIKAVTANKLIPCFMNSPPKI